MMAKVMTTGLGLAMVLLLTIFNLARDTYLNALPASVNAPAAGARPAPRFVPTGARIATALFPWAIIRCGTHRRNR